MFSLSNAPSCQQSAYLDSAAELKQGAYSAQHWAVIERSGGFWPVLTGHLIPRRKKKQIIWWSKPFTKPQDAGVFRSNWQQRAQDEDKTRYFAAPASPTFPVNCDRTLTCTAALPSPTVGAVQSASMRVAKTLWSAPMDVKTLSRKSKFDLQSKMSRFKTVKRYSTLVLYVEVTESIKVV